MRILLATDGSGSAGAALDFLLGFPFPAGSEAILLSVIDGKTFVEDKDLSDEESRTVRETRDMVQAETEQFLAGEAGRLRQAGWAGSTRIRYGDPADEIIRAAEEHDADLVVLGSHGTSGVKRFLLGSVSDRVLIYSSCSVLIIKQPAGAGTHAGTQPVEETVSGADDRWRILLAYDNSDASGKALSLCASLPLDDRAEVQVVRVMPMVTAYRQDIRQQLNTIWQQKKQAAREALDQAVQALHWSTPHVSAELREAADVSEELLDVAESTGADLIMVGCKGRSAVRRFLVGSKTNRIARHAHCSVWAVRN
jgi:nucleotide-binding universal stress UspA family protein